MCGVRAAVVNQVRARESVAGVGERFLQRAASSETRMPGANAHYCKNYRSIYEGIRS